MNSTQVFVLREGYSLQDEQGVYHANGTITLVQSNSKNILVDVGSPSDRETILKGLTDHNLKPEDIHVVVCSHGHVDHVGNLNLFPNATVQVGHDICQGDSYILHDFTQPFQLSDTVQVVSTPGHSVNDVTVLVQTNYMGKVAVAGDLFENEDDLKVPLLWQRNSHDPKLQQESRNRILLDADYIVPGHGRMFKVNRLHKIAAAAAAPPADS